MGRTQPASRGRRNRPPPRGRAGRPPSRRRSAPLVLLTVAFALGALLLLRGSSGGAPPVPASGSLSLAGAAFLGNPNATVVIDAYEDYLCPFCLRFFQSTEKPLLSAYGDRIRFVFHDFPQEGPHPFSTKAAEAARCAGDQGKYWEMHDLLYDRQGDWGYKSDSPTYFKRYGAELGLDATKFNACLANDAHRRDVLLDLDAARQKGVAGTPTFLVNGQRIVGAQPFQVFASAIESALGLEVARAAAG